jgi:asparagine synthase (glutamine-hydrolysing)
MSGIVGIINLDGAPVDRQLLQRMTEFMTYRGPDAQDIWIDGHVGFGHTMLRTTFESLRERQPCSLDDQVWITADARVDGWADLIEKLESKGRNNLEAATDVDLILHAYHVWGEDCVKHLIGDFAFAIWDGRKHRLFGARDHFGVKPFYYAQVANCLVFSNTLNCIRTHPAVSDELNELAIGDFLLFGFNQEPFSTTFADIQRLPSAHYLTWSEGVLDLTRYWTLPVDEPIRYKRASDYVDCFKELLRTAVDDRLRTNYVGVSMSGGLDSTAVAATAHNLLSKQYVSFDLRAYTVVYDKLIFDEERYYSGLVAKKLEIPVYYLVADDYKLYERWEQPELQWSEPAEHPLLAIFIDKLEQVAAHSRVVLCGEGGDPILYPSGSYFVELVKELRFGHLVTEVGQYVLSHGRLPALGFRSRLKRWLRRGKPYPCSPFPRWLNPTMATRLDLLARWVRINNEPDLVHPTRPEAYQSLGSPYWQYVFENSDPGVTSVPVEARQPFFDLRLMNYVLSVPPIPWCVNKELLREAMRGTLPESVRLRPKSPLAGDPVSELLKQRNTQWVNNFEAISDLGKYVDRDAIPQVAGAQNSADASELWIHMHPLALNYWLQNSWSLTDVKLQRES